MSGTIRSRTDLAEALHDQLTDFFAYHHKVETAPRWTCTECQFESNAFYATHHRDCSHYRPLLVGVGCGNTTNEKDDPEVEHFACPCCGAPMRTATLWRCEADPELHQWIGNWDEVIEQASVGCGNATKDTP